MRYAVHAEGDVQRNAETEIEVDPEGDPQ